MSESRRKSAVWTQFNYLSDIAAVCNICMAKLSTKGGSTANLRRHLRTKHPTVVLQDVREDPASPDTSTLNFQATTTATTPATPSNIVPTTAPVPAPAAATTSEAEATGRHRGRGPQTRLTRSVSRSIDPLRQKALDELLAKMIATDFQPCSIVEDRGFRQFTKALNQQYVLPSRKTLSNTIIPDLYRKTHEKIKEKVKRAPAVCLTTDCWTSGTTTSFMSVTCHFIDDYEMASALLACFETSERDTADDLAEQLLRVAREWDIEDKVAACVSDSAANVVEAIQNTGWPHLFCFAHTLNLIVNAGMTAIEKSVEKVKAIVEYLHKSTFATEKLRATQKQLGLPEARLKQDCPTRWNSTFYMVQNVLLNKDAVTTTLELTNPQLSTLTPEEWEELKQACELLKPFEEVTVEISAEEYVTASKVILLARGLQRIAANTQRHANLTDSVKDMVDTICTQMSHWFHNIEGNVLLTEAAALDPRFKRKAFGKDEDADRAYQHISNSAAKVNLPHQQTEEEEAVAALTSSSQDNAIWQEFDLQVSGFVTSCRNPVADAMLEVHAFLEEPLIVRSSNPLTWWKTRGVIYPRLSEVMKKRLCIVATSVPSERIFSKMGQMITERRNRMSSSKVSQIVFLNANLD